MDGQIVFQLLANYVELVDAITPRGALKGEEILNVGMMRQKTIEILQQAKEAAEAQEAEANAAPALDESPAKTAKAPKE